MKRSSKLWFSPLLLLFLIFSPSRIFAAPSLRLDPDTLTTTVNDFFEVNIVLNTDSESVFGAGAKLIFNPSFLKAETIEPTTLFADYPSAIIDNDTGLLIVSGIAASPSDSYSGTDILAKLKFQAIKPGVTKISFLFTPGDTRDSNIAVMTGNGDILGEVGDLTLTINEKDNTSDDDSDDTDDTSDDDSDDTDRISDDISDNSDTNSPSWLGSISDSIASYTDSLFQDNSIDPYEPIPQQSPRTLADLSQPVPSEETLTKPSFFTSLPFYLLSTVSLVLIIGLSFYFFITRRRAAAPPPPPPPPPPPSSPSTP